jgi:hypothetical protein
MVAGSRRRRSPTRAAPACEPLPADPATHVGRAGRGAGGRGHVRRNLHGQRALEIGLRLTGKNRGLIASPRITGGRRLVPGDGLSSRGQRTPARSTRSTRTCGTKAAGGRRNSKGARASSPSRSPARFARGGMLAAPKSPPRPAPKAAATSVPCLRTAETRLNWADRTKRRQPPPGPVLGRADGGAADLAGEARLGDHWIDERYFGIVRFTRPRLEAPGPTGRAGPARAPRRFAAAAEDLESQGRSGPRRAHHRHRRRARPARPGGPRGA